MKFVALFLLLGLQTPYVTAQQNQVLPAATQTLLNGVKNDRSKDVIKSVLMIQCSQDRIKGTGFVISSGTIVATNSHVIGTCSAEKLDGISSTTNDPIKLTALVKDVDRDLAILCPQKPLPYSLRLDDKEKNPDVETEVETWGYPLTYNQVAPLLSRGYVAGYATEPTPLGKKPVKQLVINGAVNPGNSGGPLIDRTDGKVIGVVVSKWKLWSPLIETAIQGFAHPHGFESGTFTRSNAQGRTEDVSNEEVLSEVLDEFYKSSQVMIGQAVSISELNAFLTEKRKKVSCLQ